jgi:hypothetical protein
VHRGWYLEDDEIEHPQHFAAERWTTLAGWLPKVEELDEFLRARTALTEGRSAPQTEFAFDGCLLLFGHACCEVGSIEMHAADGGTPHGTSALP